MKLVKDGFEYGVALQPPSGGCVLKPEYVCVYERTKKPAAFRRLCVETPESDP